QTAERYEEAVRIGVRHHLREAGAEPRQADRDDDDADEQSDSSAHGQMISLSIPRAFMTVPVLSSFQARKHATGQPLGGPMRCCDAATLGRPHFVTTTT